MKPSITVLLFWIFLLSAVVSVVLLMTNMNRSESKKTPKTISYSALEPYTFIRIESMPRSPWVRTDYGLGWVRPEALSDTPLTSFSGLPIYEFEVTDWDGKPTLNSDLLVIADNDGSVLSSGNNFAPYPSLLVQDRGDGLSQTGSPNSGSVGAFAGGPVASGGRANVTAPDDIATVPEPSTAALLAVLCAILAVLGYRRIAKPAAQFE